MRTDVLDCLACRLRPRLASAQHKPLLLLLLLRQLALQLQLPSRQRLHLPCRFTI
jgi:hypothetical protein